MNSNVCNVCQQAFNSPKNPLDECFICNFRVHQSCYGFTRARSIEKFYCSVCRIKPNMNSVTCELCPMKEGIFRPVEDSKKYAHVLCALCIPEVKFLDNATMEIISLKNVPRLIRRKCVLCTRESNNKGGFVKCAKENCISYIHATCCASKHLLEMPLTLELSLEKNLAILFKSPPELNIEKQYPVRLKRCLPFCGLSHLMAYKSQHPKLFLLTSSSSSSERDTITKEDQENKSLGQTNKNESQTCMEESQTRKNPICDKNESQIHKTGKDPKEIVNCNKPYAASKSQADGIPSTSTEQPGGEETAVTAIQNKKRGRPRKSTLTDLQPVMKEHQVDKSQSCIKSSQLAKQLATEKTDLNCDQSASNNDDFEEIRPASKKPREDLTTRPHKSRGSCESKTPQISEPPSLIKSIAIEEKEPQNLPKECPGATSGHKTNKGIMHNKYAKHKSYKPGRFSKTRPTSSRSTFTPSKEPRFSVFDERIYRRRETGRYSSWIKNRPKREKISFHTVARGSKVEISEISSFDDLFEWDYQQSLKKLIKNAPNSTVLSLLHDMFELKRQNKELEDEIKRLKEKEAFYRRFNENISKDIARMELPQASREGDSPPVIMSYAKNRRSSFWKTLTTRQKQPISTGHTQSTPNRTPMEVRLKLPENGGVINAEITSNGRLSIPIEFESSSLIENNESVSETPKRPSLQPISASAIEETLNELDKYIQRNKSGSCNKSS
nr:protein AF 10 [Hymenolepis microstoma]